MDTKLEILGVSLMLLTRESTHYSNDKLKHVIVDCKCIIRLTSE